MTSDAQTSSNRRNAKRSSGPRSESGKARSRMNGWHCCVEPSRGDFGVGHRTWRLARDPISPPLALFRWLRRAPYVDRVGREDHARSLNATVQAFVSSPDGLARSPFISEESYHNELVSPLPGITTIRTYPHCFISWYRAPISGYEIRARLSPTMDNVGPVLGTVDQRKNIQGPPPIEAETGLASPTSYGDPMTHSTYRSPG
jgi:hypothetical protein